MPKKKKPDGEIEISLKSVLEEIACVAFSDLGDFCEFGPNGVDIKSSKRIPKAKRRAIASVDSSVHFSESGGRTVNSKVKTHGKMQALTLLARHFGVLNEFDVAIATLRRWGIDVYQRSEPDENGFMWGIREHDPSRGSTYTEEEIRAAEDAFFQADPDY